MTPLQNILSISRCFLFFDVCYLLSGVTLMAMALTDTAVGVAEGGATVGDKYTLIISGAGFGIFATVSAMCNRSSYMYPARTYHLLY